MQVFAVYLRERGPEQQVTQPRGYFLQATAMYAIVALDFVVDYLVKGSEPAADATGLVWRSGDILETAAMTSLLAMMFVVALALVTILREPAERA